MKRRKGQKEKGESVFHFGVVRKTKAVSELTAVWVGWGRVGIVHLTSRGGKATKHTRREGGRRGVKVCMESEASCLRTPLM